MSNVAQDLTEIIKAQTEPADRHSGYLVDLHTEEGLQFEEVTNADGNTVEASWVHAMSVGSYKHPLWGKLEFTTDRVKRFAANINNRIRGIDPAVDYAHFSAGEAAGWIKKADARDDGLWIFVEWTKTAAEKIRNKEFRYFSSDFADEWEDEHGKKYKDVLFGGGLTNRPFLKNLVPVNLSELFGEGQEKGKEKQEDEPMMKELLKALGLSEDATEEEALEALNKKLQEAEPPKADPDPAPDPALDLPKELAEHPIVKTLTDQIAELQSERKLSEAKRLTESWSTHSTKKFALPPVVTEQLEEVLVESSKELQDKVSSIIDNVLDSGLVELGEKGGRRPTVEGGKDDGAIAEFNKKVKTLMEESEGMSFADAYSEVSRDESLFERYRRESLAGTITEVPEGGEE